MNDRAPRTDGRFAPGRREPDPDLVDLAYLCALDAMSASERFETMTRLGDDDVTRQRFDDIVRDIRETMAISAYSTETPAPPDLRTRILGAAADTAQLAPDGSSQITTDGSSDSVVVPLSSPSGRRRGGADRSGSGDDVLGHDRSPNCEQCSLLPRRSPPWSTLSRAVLSFCVGTERADG